MLNRVACHALMAVSLIAAPAASSQAPTPATAPDTSWVARSALYEVFVQDFSPGGQLSGRDRRARSHPVVRGERLWLMPIYPIGILNRKGSLGSPYAARDYRAINPAYGNAADFRALVEAVHARGMKLILDWVPNHTAPDHRLGQRASRLLRPRRARRAERAARRKRQADRLDRRRAARLRESQAPPRDDRQHAAIGSGSTASTASGSMSPGSSPTTSGARRCRRCVPPFPGGSSSSPNGATPRCTGLASTSPTGGTRTSRLKAVWKGAPASTFVQGELPDMRAMPPGGMRMRFTTNHDETAWDDPPVTIFGRGAGARAAFVAMALLPGRPLLYNGQEVESPQKLALFERDAIAWNQPDASQARAFYARVLGLARTNPAFIAGDLRAVETSAPGDVIAYRRGDVVVLVNARPRGVKVAVTGFEVDGARDLLSNRRQQGDTITLPAHGAVVLKRP